MLASGTGARLLSPRVQCGPGLGERALQALGPRTAGDRRQEAYGLGFFPKVVLEQAGPGSAVSPRSRMGGLCWSPHITALGRREVAVPLISRLAQEADT